MTNLVPADTRSQIELAKALAHSNLLPDAYRNNPANLLYALQYAQALGLPAIAVVTGIHVIKGKPTVSSETMRALALRAGHTVRVEATPEAATVTVIRKGDTVEQRFTFTIEDARQAGLTNSQTWKAYPRAMLTARATSEAMRAACPDILMGASYVPEELGAEVDGAGDPIQVSVTREPAPVANLEAELLDITFATSEQISKITLLAADLGLDDDAFSRGLVRIIGHDDLDQLTSEEADLVAQAMGRALAKRQETATEAETETVEEPTAA
jgi:hypothetical protein